MNGPGTTIFGISKTTIAGFLSAIIATVGPLTAYLATINSKKAAIATGIVTLVGVVCRAWIGLITGDAPLPPKEQK